MVYKMWAEIVTIYVYDRRADGRTDGRQTDRLLIARPRLQRGKNIRYGMC